MKVGVLTFHRASNYGTALQAFAMIEALRALGYDAELIDYRPDYTECTLVERKLRDARNIRTVASILVNRFIYGAAIGKKYQRFEDFCGTFRCGDTICKTMEDVAHAAQQYDVILSGSDQLWNENITGSDLTYFFPFAHQRKVSYASSFGVAMLEKAREAVIAPLLQDFAAISMREETACGMVREMLFADDAPPVMRVPDPTLLLTAAEWRQYGHPGLALPEQGYILTYYMIETPVLRAITRKLQQTTGLPVVNIKPSKRQMLQHEGVNLADAGPAEFLSCYAGAKYVVTNSFHGTVFGINFGVPMYVASLPVSVAGEVNSRLTDLLAWYGLSQRWITSAVEAEKIDPGQPLTGLDELREARRADAIRVLQAMLN